MQCRWVAIHHGRSDWVDDAEYERIRAKTGFRFDQPDGYWKRFHGAK